MTFDEHSKLCRNLKILRKTVNYTQFELSQKLSICRTSYSMVERGVRMPDIDMLQGLSQIYHISIDILLSCDISDVLTHRFLQKNEENEQMLLSLYEQLSIDAKEQLLLRAEELCHLDMVRRITS